jgi:hypothetical protein
MTTSLMQTTPDLTEARRFGGVYRGQRGRGGCQNGVKCKMQKCLKEHRYYRFRKGLYGVRLAAAGDGGDDDGKGRCGQERAEGPPMGSALRRRWEGVGADDSSKRRGLWPECRPFFADVGFSSVGFSSLDPP